MRIGINFGDNDFGSTFGPIMKIIIDAVEYNKSLEKKLTKENISQLVNGLSLSAYKMFQYTWDYDDGGDKHIGKYLKIKPEDIYLNEEIDEKLKTYSSWANRSFFYADTDNKQVDIW